jgi:hypothetical protein
MPMTLTTAQRQSLDRVITGLNTVGYPSDLIRKDYAYDDWFEADTPERVAKAAAFARKPFAPDTACFAVVTSNGAEGVALMRRLRALGAPRSFEVARGGQVFHWRVSQDPTIHDRQEEINPSQIGDVFAAHRDRWSPDAIFGQRLRARAIQLDFFDMGLIPALEEHIRERLGPRLEEILRVTQDDIVARTGRPPNLSTLFRLIFRGIAGKVLRDRGHPRFKGFRSDSDPDELFARVADYYGEPVGVGDRTTRRLIYEALWSGFSLRHISVDVLAFLYEDFLVTPEVREDRGIHATPPRVARYVVSRLPLDEVQDGRMVVEPCCGGGAFLVAALQRFRQLLPRATPQGERHEYARSRLFGADTDEFALEVARYSLMLSDYPNRNGWQLEREDVFKDRTRSPRYHDALSRAKIVLCNPPFEDIKPAARHVYGTKTPRAPAELIHRILAGTPHDACLGLVLPTQAVDGKSYSDVRDQLARRFAELELVHLPDDIFKHAELPTVLLMARRPESGHSSVCVIGGTVTDVARFTQTGFPDERYLAPRSFREIVHSLDATRFWEVWEQLKVSVDSASLEPHRGVEWKSSFPKERRTSTTPKAGYRPGYHFTGEIACYEAPPLVYLNASEEAKDRNAWNLPWHRPKVFLNRARASRGPWRLAAFPVPEDRACSENFIAIWPPEGWTSNALSAVLNGPIASAFVATHDRYIDTKTATLARVPLPGLDKMAMGRLDTMAAEYIRLVAEYRAQTALRARQLDEAQGAGLWTPAPVVGPVPSADPLRNLILEIDHVVLAAYGLPPPLERDIINFFRGSSRPLPFPFEDYETRLIGRRLHEQTRILYGDSGEQIETWKVIKSELDKDRLSSRKLFA